MTALVTTFNDVSTAPLAAGAFNAYLQERFGLATARNVAGALAKLDLPMPENGDEFLQGTEGALLFLNPYGIVIRIENEKPGQLAVRVNDSPWVLQPIATINAGRAVIEVCPGCHMDDDEASVSRLIGELMDQGYAFFDFGTANVGRLPVKTPDFPEGVPVVIDRLSVAQLTENITPVADALAAAAAAQDALYAPLRDTFTAGWEGRQSMQSFWQSCRTAVRAGTLVAGWNELPQLGYTQMNTTKVLAAINAAERYEPRLTVISPAPKPARSPGL